MQKWLDSEELADAAPTAEALAELDQDGVSDALTFELAVEEKATAPPVFEDDFAVDEASRRKPRATPAPTRSARRLPCETSSTARTPSSSAAATRARTGAAAAREARSRDTEPPPLPSPASGGGGSCDADPGSRPGHARRRLGCRREPGPGPRRRRRRSDPRPRGPSDRRAPPDRLPGDPARPRAHACQLVAVEQAYFGKNARSAIRLGEGRAVAILAATLGDVAVVELAASLVKKAVCGHGGATKDQVRSTLEATLGARARECTAGLPMDATDALALAVAAHARSRSPFAAASPRARAKKAAGPPPTSPVSRRRGIMAEFLETKLPGLELLKRGKVRDIYERPELALGEGTASPPRGDRPDLGLRRDPPGGDRRRAPSWRRSPPSGSGSSRASSRITS